MRIPIRLLTLALFAIFLDCHANSALAAINSGAKVSLTYSSTSPQIQFGSNAATASDSTSGNFTFSNRYSSTGSASSTGGTTQSFLKAEVDLSDTYYGPYDYGDPSNNGYAESAWQDVIRLSGLAPSQIRIIVGVDYTATFSDINSNASGKGQLDLFVSQSANPLNNLSSFASNSYQPFSNGYTAVGINMYATAGLPGQLISSYEIYTPNWINPSITALSPASFQFHGERAATLNYNPITGGYGFNVDLQVGGIAGGLRVISDAGHSASIVAITDLQGNDLRDRVTFDSGMQFPSAIAAVPEPTTFLAWSTFALFGLAARVRANIGDRVKITRGTFAGLVGRIRSLTTNHDFIVAIVGLPRGIYLRISRHSLALQTRRPVECSPRTP